ncbi:MAG: purine-nucleoside phosphorylase [Actinobacteria bacterium 69-20]|nr:nucleoside phosphorylase [Actinomycetota bacterium]OJV24489.1 MAG: purine-nucleoside phosphorylase [Actinobacteria bacterium 69-20]
MAPQFDDDYVLPLTRVRVGDVPTRVLAVGDPARVRKAATRLTDVREAGSNREYVTVIGRYCGTEVAIVSHGVGSAGAAVCFEEMCRGGAQRIIRSGTAGGLQPEVRDGSVVVATGAVREEGISRQLVPLAFPAVADPALVMSLRGHAADAGVPVHGGIVLTSDCFYPGPVLDVDHRLWQRAGCVAVEMELAALFVTAALHGVQAGGILAIDGNPLDENDSDMSNYEPFRDVVDRAVDAALEAALAALIDA